MWHKPRQRLLAVGLAVILTAVFGMFGYQSWAAAQLNIYTNDGMSPCGAGTAKATYQDSWVGIELGQFDAFDQVLVDLAFPDGRIFTVAAVSNLDGVVDQPVNAEFSYATDSGGATFRRFRVDNDLPYGCYKLTARAPISGKQATGLLAVIPRPAVTLPLTPASLVIQDRTTGAITGQQGAAVNIIGSGFRAHERIYIWITAPDGAVLSFPEQFSSDQFVTNDFGEFVATFEFASYNPVGLYQFTAKGSSSGGYMTIAPFTLTSRQTIQQGTAVLRVAYPASGSNPQRQSFEVQGDRFIAGERIDLWLTLPDGSVRGLPSQFADPFGNFFVVLSTDEQLPVGEYDLSAKGATGGSVVITQFNVSMTAGTQPNPFLEPAVIRSNDGAVTLGGPEFDTRTEGNIGALNAADSPGPICDVTNNWCR